MRRPQAYPLPPAISGTVGPQPAVDAWRLSLWTIQGLGYGLRKGTWSERAVTVLSLLGAVPFIVIPVLPLILYFRLRSSRIRWYFTPERTAVLSIATSRHGWSPADHAMATPGVGTAASDLRAIVNKVLTESADAQQIPMHATAAVRRLADLYVSEIPGLVIVGRAFPRGWKLYRAPRPPESR